jgi:hypothetical protein
MDQSFLDELFKKIESQSAAKKAAPKVTIAPKKLPATVKPSTNEELPKQFLREFLQKLETTLPKEPSEQVKDAPAVTAEAPSTGIKAAKPIRLIKKKQEAVAKDGKDGRTPQFEIRNDELQWKYEDEGDSAWRKLFDITEFRKSVAGMINVPGGGGGGRRIVSEFKEEDGVVYHKSSDESDDAWLPIFELPSGEAFVPQYKVEDYDVYWRATDDDEWVLMYTIPVAPPVENVGFVFDGGYPDTDYVTASPAFSCGGVV